jgi:DNA-binding NarL/FixJ family response regulator
MSAVLADGRFLHAGAGLLRDARSNAEIAARLYLSEKTVHHHVSAILRKLGVGSRSQAAREAARRGITA